MTTALLKKATKLPLSDRIKLVEDIWNSIGEEPDPFPLTRKQERELDRRLTLVKKTPGRALRWEEAKRRILKRHARAK